MAILKDVTSIPFTIDFRSLIFSNLPELLLAAEVSVVGVLLSVLDTLLGLGGGVVGAADDDLERCSTSVVKAST